MKTYDTIQMLRRLAFGATLLTATALLPACDDDPAAPDEELTTDPGTSVQPETLRFISYNILEGMKLDKAQNFDNFVDWVKEKDPDFMALCECNAFTEESLTALAGRYGHPYAILCKESGFPVGLTSKYPIELRNRLLEDVPLWHGAIHTRIKDINVVVLHLYPFGTYPNGQGAAGTGNTYRDREINCILDSTIRRYPVEPLWLMAGDFNSYSRMPTRCPRTPISRRIRSYSRAATATPCATATASSSTPFPPPTTANRRRINGGSTSSTPRRP